MWSRDAHFTAFNTHTSTIGDILNHSAFNFAMARKRVRTLASCAIAYRPTHASLEDEKIGLNSAAAARNRWVALAVEIQPQGDPPAVPELRLFLQRMETGRLNVAECSLEAQFR